MKKICFLLIAAFFGFMLFMTFSARTIRNNQLPRVNIVEIKKQIFTCEVIDESGNKYYTERRALGIEKKFVKNNIYILLEKECYGEIRTYAVEVNIQTLDYYYSDEYYAILSGISSGDKIIDTDITLSDGDEVLVEKY